MAVFALPLEPIVIILFLLFVMCLDLIQKPAVFVPSEMIFQDSFWNEISWFGFKNFGDSTLGFNAQVNHGGEEIMNNFLR